MEKRYLITSALPYINGVKHLGNLIGSMLPADVYARYLRQKGAEVLYICGTDDHGAPAEIAASDAGIAVADYVSQMYQQQRDIYQDFELSFDYFGQSSTPSNLQITQQIFKELQANGYIIEQSIKQYYSTQDQRFLADRQIIGTCPHCSYSKARGDQCDGCGVLLDPTELIEPQSALSVGDSLELRETHHLFLDLAKLQSKVSAWTETLVNPSKVVSGIIRKWLSEGLAARCITRDLDWGIPVPASGFEDKVFYVWFDAPNAYISITKDWAASNNADWQRWWLEPEQVHYTQFMAKDNVPFHAMMWPAILLGTKQNWKMVDNIKGFNWLNYEGGKFSTSQKRGVFTDKALTLFPADYWRYYLLANVPESSDADFSFRGFADVINHDLADSLGNFVARVTRLVQKYCDGQVPKVLNIDKQLQSRTEQLCRELDLCYSDLNFRTLITKLKSLWALGNEYISAEQPWIVAKTDVNRAVEILVNCLHLMRVFAIVMLPIIPSTAKRLTEVMGLEDLSTVPVALAADFSCLRSGTKIGDLKLFAKIEDEQVSSLQKEFAGHETT